MTTTEKLPEKMGGGYVEVDWELGDRYDEAGDGYCFFHHADGISKDGHMFEGTGNVCCGEWEEVEHCDFVGMEQWLPQKDKR